MFLKLFKSEHGRLFQYLATISGAFSIISSGINLGWTSPYLPQLLNNSSTIPITSDEGSWCAVMPLLGAPPGAILAAILVDRIGRKVTILSMAPIVCLCFIGTSVANSIWIMSVFRFILGAMEGGLYTVLPMYIGEISDPQIRGFLTSTVALAAIIGTLFINIIGPFTTIFTSSLISAVIPLIHFMIFIWMPESPYYHIKKQNYKAARESLRILRNSNNFENELNSLRNFVEKEETKAKITDLFTISSNRKACIIYIILCLTNKFSGKNPCLFYTTMIFEEAGSSLSPELSVIIYCSVELIATATAIVIVDKCGKRPLMIISTIGCTLSVLMLALHFYFKDYYPSFVTNLDWLPITALVSYNILFSIGLAFGPVSILSELFPINIKAIALCVADTFSISMATLASKYFQITKDEFGMWFPFFSFSVCCAVGLVFIVKYVPETKGRSLEEIQEFLIGDKSSNIDKKDNYPENI